MTPRTARNILKGIAAFVWVGFELAFYLTDGPVGLLYPPAVLVGTLLFVAMLYGIAWLGVKAEEGP